MSAQKRAGILRGPGLQPNQLKMTEHDEIITPIEVGEFLKLNPETCRELMRKGLIPAVKIGGSWRTTRGAIYGYMENKMGISGRIRVQGAKDNP